MPANKIATCCYCGTRAALRLRGKQRHELSCSNCGAPLRALKNMPVAAVQSTAPTATPARPTKRAIAPRRKDKRRPASFVRKMIAELWDEIEDVFDDLFD